jgi:hypothetical protein
MEFGVSPLVASRREMVTRGTLFGVPAFGWVPAKTTVRAKYCAFIRVTDSLPASVKWDGQSGIALS